MNNEIILEIDTRNKKDSFLTEYLDKQGIKWIRNKLYSGDVKLLNSTKVIIDLKANTEEIAHNLCNNEEHRRIRHEIEKAKVIGCERFIFLIKDDSITCLDDLKNWSSKKTKVRGSTLFKIMLTMGEKYGCRFLFTTEENVGKQVLKLLEVK